MRTLRSLTSSASPLVWLVATMLHLSLVGCPTDEPPAEDAGTSQDSGGADTSSPPDIDQDDGSTTDLGTDTPQSDVPTPDTAQPDTADAVNDTGGVDTTSQDECQTDSDCDDAFESLGACQVAICEDGECAIDGAPKGAPCDDGNPCTENDGCSVGQCAGTPIDCDDDNPCTADGCQETTGDCTHIAQSDVPCDDGDLCTGPDVCDNGFCTTEDSGCPSCDTDADCAIYDDGNACNGTPVCIGGECAAGAEAITCLDIPVGQCQQAECVPETGACVVVPKADGTLCELSGVCFGQGFCNGGSCNGAPVDCSDSNPCTADSCDPAIGCVHTPQSGSACDDGSACTTDDTCTQGVCTGVQDIVCDDGDPCTIGLCDPVTTLCSFLPNDGACDDADPCTVDDTCAAGSCAGVPKSCDDGNVCTADSCIQGFCGNVPVSCDDGNACTADSCDPAVGCVNDPGGVPCTTASDCPANACNTWTCSACGVCQAAPVSCDDGNLCTVDTCVAPTGCVHSPANGVSCDDGESCTTNDLCQGGTCTGGTNICEIGTQENPAPSCLIIKQGQPNQGDGPFWLSTGGAAFQTWCEMDILGGGWTRVARLAGERAVCSYVDPMGSSTDLISETAQSAIMALSEAGALPMAFGQILVTTPTGFFVFQSGDSEWNWSAVATGKINSSNTSTFGVQVAANSTSFQALQSVPVGANQQGPALLGGNTGSGYSVFLGVGAQQFGVFQQSAACNGLTGHDAFWGGTWLGPAAWNVAGSVYLR